jgi:N-acetylglutamate synthase-like GNAT family acetyltransferase
MISIRDGVSEDSKAVRQLIMQILKDEYNAVGEAMDLEDLHDLSQTYGGDRDLFLVAEKDGMIIGTVAVKEDSQETALLRRIYVHPDFRGKGYGDALFSEAIDFCEQHGYQNVFFRGTDRMQTAISLCLKNGFEEDDVADFGDFTMVILSKTLEISNTGASV